MPNINLMKRIFMYIALSNPSFLSFLYMFKLCVNPKSDIFGNKWN